jgi:hypothetical protein
MRFPLVAFKNTHSKGLVNTEWLTLQERFATMCAWLVYMCEGEACRQPVRPGFWQAENGLTFSGEYGLAFWGGGI